MYKIQTLNKISPRGLDLFPREDYEIASEILNPDGILVRSFKMHDMELPPSVKAIGRAGAGVNNIPVEGCTDRGIVVFNTPGANANGVKELVIAALFITSRNIIPAVAWAKELKGKGDQVPKLVEKGKSQFAGPEIAGKKLGVIGLGAIGVMVANDAAALGMEVIGYDPFISVEAAWGLSRNIQRAVGLESLVAEADYITIHAPLTNNTRGMINHDKLALMKKGVRILNFARGGLVNNADLKEALAEGGVGAYMTDFPDDDLLHIDNVIPLPHLGASTPEAEDNCASMAVTQLRNYLEHGNIKNSVNFPDCEMAPSDGGRLTVANRNVPNMVGQITAILASEGLNIDDMINKHHDGLAYNIIDFDGELTEEAAGKIRGIEGVVMVRVL
ncbi:MAG: 3-phosphoglycerate dehydrogenase [Chitinivibrionales bacterium]|nr:3-phosphoglycerate dehydrogenase [Chitinivibrionales bacterium]MBD3358523.1 3-phosphoglycerate dehydrogenase [Chitinivibrionales bacterium]